MDVIMRFDGSAEVGGEINAGLLPLIVGREKVK